MHDMQKGICKEKVEIDKELLGWIKKAYDLNKK